MHVGRDLAVVIDAAARVEDAEFADGSVDADDSAGEDDGAFTDGAVGLEPDGEEAAGEGEGEEGQAAQEVKLET